MSVARVQFRMVLGAGDLNALNAKENSRHQASGLVLEMASLIRFDKLSATAARAGFGMSLMTLADCRSCDKPAGMSSSHFCCDVSVTVLSAVPKLT